MDLLSTAKNSQAVVEEAIGAEVSAASQSRGRNSGTAGFVYANAKSLTSHEADATVPDFVPMGVVGWPDPIASLLRKRNIHSLMGLFPVLHRAWFAVDQKLVMWDYRVSSNILFFDEIPEVIVSVGTPVKPQKGVFQSHVSYILPVATTTMVILLGVTASDSDASELSVFNMGYCVESPAVLTKLVSFSKSGRVFGGGADGNLYEAVYATDGSYLLPKIRLVVFNVPFTTPVISHVSAAFSLVSQMWRGGKAPIRDLVVSDGAELLITLDEKNVLTTWRIVEGSLERASSLSHRPIGNSGAMVSPNANPLVHIFSIDSDQDDCNLVAVALNGEQFRYRHGTSPGSRAELSLRTHIPTLVPADREISVCGAAASCVLMAHCERGGKGGDELIAMNSARHAIHPHQQQRDIVTLLKGDLSLGPLEAVECVDHRSSANLLCQQVSQLPTRYILVHQRGLALYSMCRPVDTLRLVLNAHSSCREQLVQRFSSSFNPVDYAAMLLQLAIDTGRGDDKAFSLFREQAQTSMPLPASGMPLPALGRCLRQPVSLETKQLARSLLKQGVTPFLKDNVTLYGQKSITVTLSPFANGVIALCGRALAAMWTSSLLNVACSVCDGVKGVLVDLLSFLKVMEVGQHALDSLLIPYPVQWHRNRIIVSVSDSSTLSVADANKLQMIVLNTCYETIVKAVQTIHLYRQCGPLQCRDGPVVFNQIIRDKNKALEIGGWIASRLLGSDGTAMTEDALQTIAALKKDCPYFFASVDIAEFQARVELKGLSRNESLGFLSESQCTEWVSRISPVAAQYWLSGSLPILCSELCAMQRGSAAVVLLLRAAKQLDTDSKLFLLYSDRRASRDHLDPNVSSRFLSKIKVLETVVAILEDSWVRNRHTFDSLLGNGRSIGELWVVEPSDEMAHFFLFDWLCAAREDRMLCKVLKRILVASRSPHLQKYFSLNNPDLGEEYVHYLRSHQMDFNAAIEQSVRLSQSSLSHIPLVDRLAFRIHCLQEAVECARECDSNQLQALVKRHTLLEIQKSLLSIISAYMKSQHFDPHRLWTVNNENLVEGEMVKGHYDRVADNILSSTELLGIAASYPLFGGGEVQLDVLSCSGVTDPNTYALCVAQAYSVQNSSVEEVSRRLIEKYYRSTLSFPLSFVIRMLEAEQFRMHPYGSSNTVDTLLDCKVDARVVFHALQSIIDGSDPVSVPCDSFDQSGVTESYLLLSLSVAALRRNCSPGIGCARPTDSDIQCTALLKTIQHKLATERRSNEHETAALQKAVSVLTV